jgi:putative OmpL-like beta-barrel porin-2
LQNKNEKSFTESLSPFFHGGHLMRLSACVLAVAVLSPFAARAQTPPPGAPPAAPPPAAEPPPPPAAVVVPPPPPPPAAPAAAPAKTWKDLLTVEGLVDSYYMWNFTGTTSMTPPGLRQFDINSNAFTLNYAKLGLGVNADPAGLRIDLGYGATGAIINSAGRITGEPVEAFIIQQAYATIMPVANLTLDFGKFVTTAGAEVIEANKNWMYSRSLLFFNIPLLHTGVRATYKVSDALTLQASVVNGWNGTGIAGDLDKNKTFGVSINFTVPGVGTNIIATGYFGKGEPDATGAPSPDTRVLADLVVAHTVGALGLNLNFDYVNDKAGGIDGFYGVAPMVHYALNDHMAASARFEYAHTAPGVHVIEGTVNLGIGLGGHFEFRPEIRVDNSNVAQFDPPGATGQDKTQVTGTAAFLAWF